MSPGRNPPCAVATTKLSAVSVSERIERMVPVWSPPLAFMALTPLMALISRLPFAGTI